MKCYLVTFGCNEAARPDAKLPVWRVGHGGYECMENEMCRFAGDMSKQTNCIYIFYFTITKQIISDIFCFSGNHFP